MTKSNFIRAILIPLCGLLLIAPITFAQDAPQLIAPAGYLDKFWSECEQAKSIGRTISVIHLGDSHVQAGHYTMPIREAFTQAWGDGGIGWVGAYRLLGTNAPIHTAIRASSSGTSGVKITKRDYDRESPTGMVLQTRANARITYTLQCGNEQTFDRIVLYRQQGGKPFALAGTVKAEVTHDTLTMQRIVTDTFQLSTPVSSAQVTAPALCTWYGASLERSSGGVIVHTIGYNGATYYTYSKGSFTSSVAALEPQLIILSLGTNGSLSRGFDRNEFAEEVARVVRRLQESNSDCAIVLTSPLYSYRKVRVRQRGKRRRYRNSYQANANCKLIAEELQKQAEALGCGYIDLFSYYGGEEGAAQLLSDGILSRDHVHLTATGYNKVGRAIADALLTDYERSQKRLLPIAPPPISLSED